MGNLWKALLHGNAKTKLLIIFMFIMTIGGVILLILGISNMSLIMLGGGAICSVVGLLIMFSATFTMTEKKAPPKANNYQSLTDAKRRELLSISNAGYNVKSKNDSVLKNEKNNRNKKSDDTTIDILGEDEKSSAIASSKSTINRQDISEKVDIEEQELEEPIDTEGLSEKEIEYAKRVKSQKRMNNEKYGVVGLDGEEEEKQQSEERQQLMYQPTDKKSAALRKKLLKVKPGDKKYTPIFVDACKSLVTYRTPAYVQIKGKDVIIMLMERNIRTHIIPLKKFLEVNYARNVEEKSPESYDVLKDDKELYTVFEDLLPSLFPTNNVLSSTMLKNQYILADDIAISARSMKNLINKYEFNFHLFDALSLKGEYSDYFKMAYENRILWMDNCITQVEYQNRIRGVLQMMVDDDEILEYDMENDTDMMVRYKLITTEYADFYIGKKRERIQKR